MDRRRTILLLASAIATLAAALFARVWLPTVVLIASLYWASEMHGWICRQFDDADDRRAAFAARAFRASPDGTEEFLGAVDRSLGLPAHIRAEIRSELADHLADSIASLEAEGLSPGAATREALARLGNAEELAGQLRMAHQSRRRLLAGAAGGVWAAGVGAIQVYLVVIIVAIIVAVFGALFLQGPVDFIANRLPLNFDQYGAVQGSLIGCVLAWTPAFFAGRWAVRDSSELMHRTTRQVGAWWAGAGVLGLGWLLVFEMSAYQGWLVVPFELAIPAFFAVGALLAVERDLPVIRMPAWAWIGLVVILVAGPVLLVTAFASGTSDGGSSLTVVEAHPYDPAALGYDRVAPAWSKDHYYPPILDMDGFQNLAWGAQIRDQRWDIRDAAAFAGFAEVRMEVWRATSASGDDPPFLQPAVEAGRDRPYLTSAARRVGDSFSVHIDLSHVRHPYWLVFMTGTGSDGHRYRLAEPYSLRTLFSGTIWDWITAGD